MIIEINKLFSILTYGHDIDVTSPWYKKHSSIIPTIKAMQLRDILFLSVDKKDIIKAAFLICYIVTESSLWPSIIEIDNNNSYKCETTDMFKQLNKVASALNVEGAFNALSSQVRSSYYEATWLDKLGVVALYLLKGHI